MFTPHNEETDPSDWKSTNLPELAGLDSIIRCPICKNFMDAPVLTKCGHSFCSRCLRKSLLHKPKTCPYCAQSIEESDARKNLLLDQLNRWYKRHRSSLIEKSRKFEVTRNLVYEPTKSPVNNERLSPSGEANEMTTKDDFVNDKANAPAVNDSSTDEIIEIDDEDEEELQEFQKQHINGFRSEDSNNFKKASSDKTDSRSGNRRLIEEEKYSSPVRNQRGVAEVSSTSPFSLKADDLDSQLHTRKKVVSAAALLMSKGSRTGLPEKDRVQKSYYERNPQSDYLSRMDQSDIPAIPTQPKNDQTEIPINPIRSDISYARLKDTLNQYGLPTSGTRSELMLRLERFRVFFNSNLDSIEPLPRRVVVRLFLSNEAVESHNPLSENSEDRSSEESEESRKNRIEHSRAYNKSYKELAREARRKMNAKKEAKENGNSKSLRDYVVILEDEEQEKEQKKNEEADQKLLSTIDKELDYFGSTDTEKNEDTREATSDKQEQLFVSTDQPSQHVISRSSPATEINGSNVPGSSNINIKDRESLFVKDNDESYLSTFSMEDEESRFNGMGSESEFDEDDDDDVIFQKRQAKIQGKPLESATADSTVVPEAVPPDVKKAERRKPEFASEFFRSVESVYTTPKRYKRSPTMLSSSSPQRILSGDDSTKRTFNTDHKNTPARKTYTHNQSPARLSPFKTINTVSDDDEVIELE